MGIILFPLSEVNHRCTNTLSSDFPQLNVKHTTKLPWPTPLRPLPPPPLRKLLLPVQRRPPPRRTAPRPRRTALRPRRTVLRPRRRNLQKNLQIRRPLRGKPMRAAKLRPPRRRLPSSRRSHKRRFPRPSPVNPPTRLKLQNLRPRPLPKEA